MSQAVYGWTTSLDQTSLYIDPSGVQATSTDFQVALMPGLTTVTRNVRYLSLFAAARYHRMMVDDRQIGLDYSTYMERFESLIGACSVAHHPTDLANVRGIVGVTAARRHVSQVRVPLRQEVRLRAYQMYRGTLGELRIFDIGKPTDPLVETARDVALSWEPPNDGDLRNDLRSGTLPPYLARERVWDMAEQLCLCRVPPGSREQHELVKLLLLLGQHVDLPTFQPDESAPLGYRTAGWRFLLEVVDRSRGVPLQGNVLMARLLDQDLLSSAFPAVLRTELFCWRWVASRTLVEIGWTHVFIRAFDQLLGAPNGLTPTQLRQSIREEYLVSARKDESLGAIAAEADLLCSAASWTRATFTPPTARDDLIAMVAGLFLANVDRDRANVGSCQRLWAQGPISFQDEFNRLQQRRRENIAASDYWAELAEASLVHHVQLSLAKIAAGNPDSLLVDFDDQRWIVPPKGREARGPLAASGFSRLDIALGWAEQLGLTERRDEGFALTEFGRSTCDAWDREYLA
jgi:hypothetical protein